MRPGKLEARIATNQRRATLWYVFRLTRPVFLLGGVLLCILGTVLAVHDGQRFDLSRYLIAQILVTTVQLLAQYTNEWYDIEVDRLNAENRTWFSGGSGILSAGQVQPTFVRGLLAGLLGFSAILILLTGMVAPAVLPITILSILAAWFYSAPPLALMSTGWGELSASIVVALFVPMTGYGFQTGHWRGDFLWLCAPLMIIHLAMLLAFELPDFPSDQQAGKRTLAVRFGLSWAARVHAALLLAGFFLLPVIWSGFPASRWSLLLLPLALFQSYRVIQVSHSMERYRYHWLTLRAVALFALSALLCLIAVLLSLPG